MTNPQISLVIPTLNEADNLPLLIERIDAVLRWRSYEIIVVDDGSTDATVRLAWRLAEKYPVHTLRRDRPTDGLSGAVLHGMAAAKGEFIVVMDADLQHPPEQIPQLLSPLEGNQADFVLGSRYVNGGSIEGQWGLGRRINSLAANLLARPLVGNLRDPMSGFFALRRTAYEQAAGLTPLGYKIALELICKCRVQRVCEVPIRFARRAAGSSKLCIKEQVNYLKHLRRLYAFVFPGAIRRMRQAAVAGTGLAVALSAALASTVAPPPVVLSALVGAAMLIVAVSEGIAWARPRPVPETSSSTSTHDSQTFRKAA